ncbi:phosphatase PAP2 family protein [Sinomonas gamaensis]|uniref:phosphatase PAP2 family protein n=1 Tax=Sinomonas gamaensis TaxID=2565624 RepID=UPI00148697A9|nr:phosphatase PAP2 family protein [Sinomonas gamaensis]
MREALAALGRRLGPYASLWSLLVAGLAVILLLSWAAGEVYESVKEHDALAALDVPALQYAMSLRTPGLDTAVTLFTDIGGNLGAPIVAAGATAVLAAAYHQRLPVIFIPAATVGAFLITFSGKTITGRSRPPLADAVPPYEYSPSFPSGHTLNGTVIAGVTVYLLCLYLRRVSARVLAVIVGVTYAGAMGLSRVFLGHHWLTDVVAGWVIGLAWLSAVVLAHRAFRLVRAQRAQGVGRSPS